MHAQAKAVFNEVGYFADLNRDYANCYLGDEPTRDIRFHNDIISDIIN